jgi:hypothetical protein
MLNFGYSFLLFFLSPLLGLISGLRTLDRKGKLWVFSMFGLFYGVLILYTEGNDASKHAAKVEEYQQFGIYEFFYRLVKIVTLTPIDQNVTEPYLHFLLALSGSLFKSSFILFGLVGVVYGYFYGSALLKVIKFNKTDKISLIVFSLIILFVIHRSYEGMQTIRSWTGMWVLFNGVAGYHLTKNRKYIILIFLSPLFHLMYAFIALPSILVILFPKVSPKLIIGLYLFSFMFNINTSSILNLASQNDLTQKRMGAYYRIDEGTGEGIDTISIRNESADENRVWYASLGKSSAVYTGATIFIVTLIIFGFFSKNKLTDLEYGLLATCILMASLANFMNFSFAFYSRIMANATTYILAVMLLLAIRRQFEYINASFLKRSIVWLGFLIFIPKIIFFLSSFMLMTSYLLIALPVLRLFGEDFNFSIRELVDLII